MTMSGVALTKRGLWAIAFVTPVCRGMVTSLPIAALSDSDFPIWRRAGHRDLRRSVSCRGAAAR
jgi:hypothetical protein